ncbi:UDP-N-acetylmuramoylalanine--D-glutamate ligase [hydrothermal vent metagenome]|uniref:UDP-N-acetylmuramoylalanine--D-glutamate ligase n=1 Tax=hydrothermal vent metagenome TaxID=652676 RepID=A0A3B0SR51_9ZZZZ
MNLSDIETRNIAIWGLGEEGMASYHFLRSHFPDKMIFLINRDRPGKLPEDDHISFIPEDRLKENTGHIDLVIKSPGISLYHPLVTLLRQHDIRVTSATNIWFALPRRGRVIAVTGSNGKSTTCALLHHILKAMGLASEIGGNMGTPLLSLAGGGDYYIVELSSYQTADLIIAPDIALLLNLFPEHIQWHQSHDQYFTDKANLIRTGAKTVILNHGDPLTREKIGHIPENTLWFNAPSAIHCTDRHILSGDDILGNLKDITLPGNHNRENICAALTVCRELGLDLKSCFRLAASFEGLPHRLENLGITGGRIYINDSISTTPEATIAALKSFEGQEITLIMGGQDRQQDYGHFTQYIHNHPNLKIIVAYETGPKILAALNKIDPPVPVIQADDLKNAVAIAQKITPDGGIIMLSPAAPSYDAFRNFEQRGDSFKSLRQKRP